MALDDAAIAAFEGRIGYHFRQRSLLLRALTHKSYSHEARNRSTPHNETYEFLGDSVLGFAIGDLLVRRFPAHDEGALSKMRAYLVSAPYLAQKAREAGMGPMLLLGVGEEKSGGRNKDSLLANLFEAVIAAIYLDGGIEHARELIEQWFSRDIDEIGKTDLLFRDYKTALQEVAQGVGLPLPEYRVIEEKGPDHEKRFVVEVVLNREISARGEGSSKKEAQQQAAREALRIYRESIAARGTASG